MGCSSRALFKEIEVVDMATEYNFEALDGILTTLGFFFNHIR